MPSKQVFVNIPMSGPVEFILRFPNGSERIVHVRDINISRDGMSGDFLDVTISGVMEPETEYRPDCGDLYDVGSTKQSKSVWICPFCATTNELTDERCIVCHYHNTSIGRIP